jgi:hypothetical protein
LDNYRITESSSKTRTTCCAGLKKGSEWKSYGYVEVQKQHIYRDGFWTEVEKFVSGLSELGKRF